MMQLLMLLSTKKKEGSQHYFFGWQPNGAAQKILLFCERILG